MEKVDGKTSSSYALNGTWSQIKERNELTLGMVVQLWAFRIEDELYFALAKINEIRVRYFIPLDYDILVPSPTDRTPCPPVGYRTFHGAHLMSGVNSDAQSHVEPNAEVAEMADNPNVQE
ncbi:hypothetical protein BUALT_Bualt03G0149300 [Buddleja alternifolia]|uniref:Uncharacterized protein n=1 Tax=Buddleja alternifolia TaxID=168488 RepID=A0AAV6XW47_9LAMI|nr:hypothetical protein BUALT_Bualt03G0149300 [Buddleja alternifolia]